jgi:hypothetical protein
VAGVVDHHIETPIVGNDFCDSGRGGFIGGDVEFDGPEIDAVLGGVTHDLGDLRGIAAGGLAHAGIDDVAGMSECTGSERAKAAGSAGDDDDLFHDMYP